MEGTPLNLLGIRAQAALQMGLTYRVRYWGYWRNGFLEDNRGTWKLHLNSEFWVVGEYARQSTSEYHIQVMYTRIASGGERKCSPTLRNTSCLLTYY
ncbi:hypothetical protein JTE90_016967 [Oedothorax gibbosus]|uniref:Uncharacterized protein n=1 Tax=Oedothorax gibbosus TaxID=931172 RepID=A0AAV6UGL7_9ARAC|nr:hypothetical protein JTE90_016967 [Oedothorax gibbosus]